MTRAALEAYVDGEQRARRSLGGPAEPGGPLHAHPRLPDGLSRNDMDDLEYPEIQALLSTPGRRHPRAGRPARASSAARSRPAAPSRCCRRGWATWPRRPRPSAPSDGVLVAAPARRRQRRPEHGRPHARPRRPRPLPVRSAGNLAVTGALPLADGLGLNPGCPSSRPGGTPARSAVVRGVGPDRQRPQPLHLDRHLDGRHAPTAPATRAGWAAGSTACRSRPPASAACTIGPSVPLHMRGRTLGRSPRSRPAATSSAPTAASRG